MLLVGYDGSTHEYVVRDPASGRPHLRVGAAALDAARRAFGTDEDLLVVQLPDMSCSGAAVGGAGGGGVGVGAAGGMGAGGRDEDLLMAQAPPGGEGVEAAGLGDQRRSDVLMAGGGGREEDLLVVQLPAGGGRGGLCGGRQGGPGHRRHESGRGLVQGVGPGAVGIEVGGGRVHVRRGEDELEAVGALFRLEAAGEGGGDGQEDGEPLLGMEVEVQVEHACGHGGPGGALWGCRQERRVQLEEGAGSAACLEVVVCGGGIGSGQVEPQRQGPCQLQDYQQLQQCGTGDRLEQTGHGASRGGHADLGGGRALQGDAEGRVGPCGAAGAVGEGGTAAGWGVGRVLGATGGGLRLLTG